MGVVLHRTSTQKDECIGAAGNSTMMRGDVEGRWRWLAQLIGNYAASPVTAA
jgi:hypothetical protein